MKFQDISIVNEEEFIFDLENVRLSFPNIHERDIRNGKPKSFSTKILLHKDKDNGYIAELKKLSRKFGKDTEIKKNFRRAYLLDGDIGKKRRKKKARPEYENNMVLSAYNPDKVFELHPHETDDHGKPIIIDDINKSLIYSGCYANVRLKFWYSKDWNSLNLNILSIQFSKHGAPFSNAIIEYRKAIKGFKPIKGKPFKKKGGKK